MRLDNLPTGVFTAGPAPKVQKSPRLLRKMRALLFRLRVLFPAWDVPPSFFCRSSARAGSFALPAPWIPPCPGFRKAPVFPFAALFCARRSFHGGRRRGTHNANIRRVEQRRRPLRLRGTPSAAYPAESFRNNPVAGLPLRLPLSLPRGRHRARLPRPRRACAKIYRIFPQKALNFPML